VQNWPATEYQEGQDTDVGVKNRKKASPWEPVLCHNDRDVCHLDEQTSRPG